jgi:hypothetical protein
LDADADGCFEASNLWSRQLSNANGWIAFSQKNTFFAKAKDINVFHQNNVMIIMMVIFLPLQKAREIGTAMPR